MAILDDVKAALSVVGDHADTALGLHIEAVKAYLRGAGVSEEAIEGDAAKGCIIRGVADLWNTGSGSVGFSPAFFDMAVQLAIVHGEASE